MKSLSNLFNEGNVAMNPEILSIYAREIRAAARESFGLSPEIVEEFVGEETEVVAPKVQTHASPTKSGLSQSQKKTMTSRLIAIPTGSSRIYKGSNAKLERIRAVAYYVNRQHNVVLNCTKTGYCLKVVRVA